MQETLKLFGLYNDAKETTTSGVVVGRTEATSFDAFLKPATTGAVLDVGVFHANRPAIGVLQLRENLRDRQHLASHEIRRIKSLGWGQGIEPQSLVRQFEVRGRGSQRVGLGLQMSQRAIGVNGSENLELAGSIDGRTRHHGPAFSSLRRKREPELKAFEEGAPIRLDRLRVLFPTLVVLRDQVGVPA